MSEYSEIEVIYGHVFREILLAAEKGQKIPTC